MLAGGARKVIAIAASTGGVEALEKVLARFPGSAPPIVVVLHMPPGFTKIYATRLNGKLNISVKEAQTGDVLKQGQALIAPAGKHMQIINNSGKVQINCFHGEKVQSVIPSADVLFDSVADMFRQNAIGVILTGMGADGARGLLKMREYGATTIGQDKATSAIYGMPKVAKEMGSVMHELPLDQIADKVLSSI